MRYVFLLCIACISAQSNAQVFNTGEILRTGNWSIGINPVLHSENDLSLFLHGGVGLGHGMDLAANLGIGEGDTYFGMDLEWLLHGSMPVLSLGGGAHIQHDVGLDGTLNLTFPINRYFHLYTGADMDINFGDGHTYMPAWLFIGNEVPIKNRVSFILEVLVGISHDADNKLSGGINFYL